jgi:hypothetical protein
VRVRRRPPGRLGFLQLCADRRFHRLTMDAFEEATGFAPTDYWIEALAGGAPAVALRTRATEFARSQGATVMGWAAHGDDCGGFPGADDERIRAMLATTVARRRLEYPGAEHLVFFGSGRRVSRVL